MEILQRVLRLYINSIPSTELEINFIHIKSRRIRERKLAALRVCQLWRTILLQNPRDWTFLGVGFNFERAAGADGLGEYASHQVARVKERLQWAKHELVDFRLATSGTEDAMETAEYEIWSIFTETQVIFKSLMEDTKYKGILYKILPQIAPYQLGVLTQLQVKEPWRLASQYPIWRSGVVFEHLDILRLDCATLDPLSTLRQFRCPNLTKLILCYDGQRYLRHCVKYLSLFPKLKNFAADMSPKRSLTDVERLHPHPSITHLVLTHKILSDGQRLSASMAIAFPNLTSLTLEYIDHLVDLLKFSTNAPFVQSITTLQIAKCGSSEKQVTGNNLESWAKVFNAMRNIRYLRVGYSHSLKFGSMFRQWLGERSERNDDIGGQEVNEILIVLNQEIGGETYIDRLEKLHLEVQLDPFSLMTLTSVLKSRYLRSLAGDYPACKVVLLGCTFNPNLDQCPVDQINDIGGLLYPELVDTAFIGNRSLRAVREVIRSTGSFTTHRRVLYA